MNPNKALVVFSGGQDSTTCLFWAKKHFEEVYALSFLYGQKHVKEVEIAREIARKAEVHFDVMDVPLIGQLGKNSLTDTSIPMDETKPEDTFPNTFVPGRNLFFLSIAAVYARERGIRHLVTGVSQTDFSGYPDCRDSFIKSLNVTLNLAMDEQFVIHTPLMWIDKAQTWAPRNPDMLQRNPRRRMRTLPRLQIAPRRIREILSKLVTTDYTDLIN